MLLMAKNLAIFNNSSKTEPLLIAVSRAMEEFIGQEQP